MRAAALAGSNGSQLADPEAMQARSALFLQSVRLMF